MKNHRTAFGRYLRHLRELRNITQTELEEQLVERCKSLIPLGTFPNQTNFPVKVISLLETGARRIGLQKYSLIIKETDAILEAKGMLVEAYHNPTKIDTEFYEESVPTSKPTDSETYDDDRFDYVMLVSTMLNWEKTKFSGRQRAVQTIADFLHKNNVPINPNNSELRMFVNLAFDIAVIHKTKNKTIES